MSRQFELGDVLTITTGRLVASRHIEAVYDLLGFMTGDTLWTHQLPRVAEECKPHLVAQHPWLAEVEPPDDLGSREKCDGWVASVAATHGTHVAVEPLAAEDHTHIGPLDELLMRGVPADRILPVVVEDGTS